MFAVVVENRTKETMMKVLSENVERGSTVYTDMWKSYTGVPAGIECKHGAVYHSKFFKDHKTGVHINAIEGNWSGMKIKTPPRVRTQSKINFFISEFIWRRQNEDDLLGGFLMALKEYEYSPE